MYYYNFKIFRFPFQCHVLITMVLTYSSEGKHSLLQTIKSLGPRSLDERDRQFVAQASLVPPS